MSKVIKIITVIVALVLLMSAAVLTTVSFLTSRDSVTNTFTAGKVALTLDEAEVDEYGVKVNDKDARVTDNQYKLIPGWSYCKDPTVTVLANSERSYVRIIMTIYNFKEYEASMANEVNNYLDIFEGLDNNVWEYYGKKLNTAENTITVEFRYNGTPDGTLTDPKAKGNVLEPLFTGFTLPKSLTGEQLERLYGDPNDPKKHFKITLEAHAIQASGFDDDDSAWNAFEAQMASQVASGG